MSAPSHPPRRFKPEPLETSTKSSKPARRFAPEPVETSTKSSKHRHPTEESAENATKKAPRKFAVEPVETSHTNNKDKNGEVKENKPRKFAVEPVETSHVRSKDKTDNGKEGKPRRFAPEPVETSHVSSKDKAAPAKEGKARPRFAPQLLETSEKAHRRKSANDADGKPARKFAPQLIETAQRSRKAGDVGPTVLHSDRTEATPEDRGEHTVQRRQNRKLDGAFESPPYRSPRSTSEEIAECRRLGIPLPKRQTSRDTNRSHSFYVPELAPIESSESERSDNDDSNAPSLSTSPSVGSDISSHMHATRVRESIDDRFSGYFLELAARAAERQMRDQALAAFPNDDRHNPIDHYINKDRDDDSYMSDAWSIAEGDSNGSGKFKKINWEMREVQRHAEGKAAAKEKERVRKEAWRKFQKKTSANGPWGNAAAALYQSAAANDDKDMIGGWQERDGLKQMQKGARPPMLGSDIEFPRCPSPEPAKFDVTQGSEKIRREMCYLSEQSDAADRGDKQDGGLWNRAKDDNRPTLWSKDEETPEPDKGLWAGCCVGTGLTPPRGPTGLMTPAVNHDDPEDVAAHARGLHQLPPSPPPSNSGAGSLEEKLELEHAIDAEFSDAFVTQVYNYLSLGYPSMARKYDFELAKISRIDVQELRQDDAIAGAGARGYIRLGEENGLGCEEVGDDDGEIREEHCARWRALRLYVREWARQQPGWHGQNGAGWGTAVRRGSWAW